MISKNKVKYLKSLQLKKIRKIHREFLVEGAKSVLELLKSDYVVKDIFLTENFLNCYENQLNESKVAYEVCTQKELEVVGSLITNDSAIAVAEIKENKFLGIEEDEFVLALDDIKDPGNLGTIIRIADWFGIKKIICSEETTDFYAPKVISATMGSFSRIAVYYCNLEEYLLKSGKKIFGASLSGDNVHHVAFGKAGIILLGNESRGINTNNNKLINTSIKIPGYGGAESLNVAIAGAIICDNLRRTQENI